MGLSEEQLVKQMEQWHPYAFNMGHGKTIPFKDYQEAAQVLMERNMTEVLYDRPRPRRRSGQRHMCLKCLGSWM